MIVTTLDKLEQAKRDIRDSARSIQFVGCDRRCRRAGRFRNERHTVTCEARTRVAEALMAYADLLASDIFSKQAKAAIDAELLRFKVAYSKAGM